MKEKPVRVAFKCDVPYPQGGLESAMIGLISALGKLQDGDEEYLIVVSSERPDWLRPYIGKNQTLVTTKQQEELVPDRVELRKRKLGPLRPIARMAKWILKGPPELKRASSVDWWRQIPISDGFYEDLNCDVLHIPFQNFVLCSIPTIYNPHDLQHFHFPQFFEPKIISWRETIYSAGCHFSNTIAVASSWIKEDILKHYHVPSEKIQVIPYGAPTLAYAPVSNENLERVRSKFDLKTPFFFYPAFTHRHKNHIRLLEALNLVREHHQLKTNLVCCGSQTDFWPEIEKTILSLNLKEHVKFLGFLSEADVKALYSLAEFVIIPTLFEASSLPVCEAWLEGKAVACSAVTSLPDQVGKAALLFNPLSVESIADAINTLTTDKNRRELLKQLGANRLSDFNWDRTARAYRALYRRAAGRLLSNEEKFLLSWDWMLHPDRVDQSPAV